MCGDLIPVAYHRCLRRMAIDSNRKTVSVLTNRTPERSRSVGVSAAVQVRLTGKVNPSKQNLKTLVHPMPRYGADAQSSNRVGKDASNWPLVKTG
jgi:hypothetical protein